MFYHIFVTGCQYNYHDANHIAHLVEKMGYVYVDDEKAADVIIVLACSVRQKAIDRIYGKLRIWKSLPQKPKIIITGCLLPHDRRKLELKVEAIIKIDNIEKELPKFIVRAESRTLQDRLLQRTSSESKNKYNNFFPSDAEPKTAYIPIMQGCDNFCTYCAVPYTRGRERSRPMKEILDEIKSEIELGKKHIILLGQNVNSYNAKRKTKNEKHLSKNQFTELLEKIDILPSDFDFNFMSSNPQDFSDELVNTLPKLKKWQKILHLPLQSGDDKILKAMNRKYSSSQYLKLIKNLKSRFAEAEKIKNLEVTTDLIVGFPGETKTQFENTVKLCKKIGFSKAYVSQYSPRLGTPATKMKDDVTRTEKKRRWETLNRLINMKK